MVQIRVNGQTIETDAEPGTRTITLGLTYYFGKRALRIDPADLRAMRREVNPATYAAQNGGDAA